MHGQRLTWLTNAFNGKLESSELAVNLNLTYFNFTKSYLATRSTQGMVAGESCPWNRRSRWQLPETSGGGGKLTRKTRNINYDIERKS